MVKPTKLGFECRYSDDSGVEVGVYYDESEGSMWPVRVESTGQSASFEMSRLDWVIESLQRIRDLTSEPPTTEGEA